MARSDRGTTRLERVIPLPKQIKVEGSVHVLRQEVSLALPAEPWPVLESIRGLLAPFATGRDGSRFQIRVVTSDASLPTRVSEALRQVPNADQAYAIEPTYGDGAFSGLILIANAPAGLLYAARTLAQLVLRPEGDGGRVEIPCVTVLDWPDIPERGQWGGNVRDDIEWTSQFKLNTVEVIAEAYVDEAGKPRIEMRPEYVDRARELGVKVVPYISHLEQVALRAGLMDRPDLTSTPDPSRPLPSEYVPGLCMSSPATVELVGAWMAEIARLDGVEDVEVWLSEDRAPCFCERCRGIEPFELEVRCVARAFEKAREINPSIRLWILTTQGSYSVNDKVLATAPMDAGVTYYDGGRTYDSSHRPMIYPLLEDYARSGRWLGVYPQLTHSWRTVFPWTAPQFIRARAQEFAHKGLRRAIGYAVPDNRHHEFNVMAWGEWTWNAEGRTPEMFGRAYAWSRGIASPGLFAEWAVKAGDAGWWLAESRLFLRAIYDPSIALREIAPVDFRFQQSDLLYDRAQIESSLVVAEEALDLARRLRDVDAAAGEDAVDETEALCAGLRGLLAIGAIRRIVNQASPDARAIEELAAAARALDHAAAVVSTRVAHWGARVDRAFSEDSPFWGISRLRDTANVLLRVSDAVRKRIADLGIPDPYPEHRLQPIGAWSAHDFGRVKATLRLDVTTVVPGTWFVGFDYDGGDLGAIVERVTLSCHDAMTGVTECAKTIDGQVYVGRWERWHEIKVVVPEGMVSGTATLEITMHPRMLGDSLSDTWACNGRIGIRQGWPEGIPYAAITRSAGYAGS